MLLLVKWETFLNPNTSLRDEFRPPSSQAIREDAHYSWEVLESAVES
jgi:hypothetical protein